MFAESATQLVLNLGMDGTFVLFGLDLVDGIG